MSFQKSSIRPLTLSPLISVNHIAHILGIHRRLRVLVIIIVCISQHNKYILNIKRNLQYNWSGLAIHSLAIHSVVFRSHGWTEKLIIRMSGRT